MTNQYLLARIAGRDPNLRASDADRERIADRLRKSHAEGRLDTEELQQRLERCYDAKTFGELGELVRDLPRETGEDERHATGWLRPSRWPVLVPILIALLAVSAVAGGHEHHSYWFGWLWVPLIFFVWRLSSRRRRHWGTGPRRGSDSWL